MLLRAVRDWKGAQETVQRFRDPGLDLLWPNIVLWNDLGFYPDTHIARLLHRKDRGQQPVGVEIVTDYLC